MITLVSIIEAELEVCMCATQLIKLKIFNVFKVQNICCINYSVSDYGTNYLGNVETVAVAA